MIKQKLPFGWLVASFALCLAPTHLVTSASASAAGTGVITGQVSNAATGSYLEGAVVELVGTGLTALTDREGRYQLSGIPAATQTLVVSYSGLDVQRISVAVSPGEKVSRDVALNSEIYKMEKFTVSGIREGTALAETLQRRAPNVKNVVASDAFGRVADGNVTLLLQQLPGVYGEINGTDVRGVHIRGSTPELNSVTMDGQQMASAASGLAVRRFEFDQQSLNQIERIEVIKAPTPDMEGASIGGSVNLITKSAFNRTGGRLFTYSAGITSQLSTHPDTFWWKEPIPGLSPSLSYSYSDIYGANHNFGVTLTGTYHSLQQVMPTQTFQNEAKVDRGPVYTNNWLRREQIVARTRFANAVKFEYRWSEHTTLTLNTAYNFFHQMDQNPQITFNTARTLATVDANGNRTGGGAINPNYADGITRIFAVAGNTATWNASASDRSGRTLVFAPSMRHESDGLKVDLGMSYSKGSSHGDSQPTNRKFDAPPSGTLAASISNIGFNIDRSKDIEFPTLIQTAGPNLYNLDNYTNLILTQGQSRGWDTVLAGKLDVRKDLRLVVPTYLKAGLAYNRQKREIWSADRRYNYSGPDGIRGNADDNQGIGQFLDRGRHTTDSEWLRYFRDPGGVLPFPSVFGAARQMELRPELWAEDIAFGAQDRLASQQWAIEQVQAAYVMGDVKLGKVSVMAGVRTEETRDSAEGSLNYISPEERARRAAWGTAPVTNAEARRRAEAQFGGRKSFKGKYRDYFPGIHLRFEPFDRLLTRLSWSTGVGRPSFAAIMPNDTVNEDTQRVTSPNPDLKPQHSDSYDFSVEYYLRPQGMVSVGLFRKDLTDFIFSANNVIIGSGPDNGFDGRYPGYIWTTSLNGGNAKIEGIELSYQQQLTMLPGWAKGLGVTLNYTDTRTEGNYGGTTTVANSELPNFIRNNGNIILSYRGHGLELRARAGYRGMQFITQNANAAMKQFRKPSWTINWQSSYAISRTTSVFLDVSNIFSASVGDQYLLYPERISRIAVFAPVVTAGISGRF